MAKAAARRAARDERERAARDEEVATRLDVDGWLAIPDVLDATAAAELAARCDRDLAALGLDVRTGDKPVSGTRRLTDLPERVPEVRAVVDHPALRRVVAHVLGPAPAGPSVTYRSPGPGFGGQRLHADAVPMLRPGPWQVVTAIVALCDFDETNGATGLVPGSHRRPDLQRRSGGMEHHGDELVLTGPAGTAFVFIGHVLHRGRTNRSDRPRPALQAVWGEVARSTADGSPPIG